MHRRQRQPQISRDARREKGSGSCQHQVLSSERVTCRWESLVPAACTLLPAPWEPRENRDAIVGVGVGMGGAGLGLGRPLGCHW